jgi:hypothetical protein
MHLRFFPLLLVFLLAPAYASGHDPSVKDCLGSPVPQSLVRSLAQSGFGKPSEYVAYMYDLNSDGGLEAVVYLKGTGWCGSGGCGLLVLQQRSNKWAVVGDAGIVKLPIRVLPQQSHGWHSLGVEVQGGGIIEGYEAALDFNGIRYPSNPSMPPAHPLHGRRLGSIIMEYSSLGEIVCRPHIKP